MSDEIKSTMEKVMERLAAMDAAGGGQVDLGEEDRREGMRLAAACLRSEVASLNAELAAAPPQRQMALRQGMAGTLLRNIFLPREEEQLAPAEKAMAGLLELAGEQGGGELLRLLGDLKKILEQYLAHCRQLRQQLGEQFAQQLAAMEGNLARQTGVAMKLSPEQHPKFQEEWQRIQDELNLQYGRAVEQHKQHLAAIFNAGS
ncbi:DUF6657 family protein [Desulfurivibrio sp. D14AmB]|uniref:DUF6657 family protein n=1 Tax=Desulfurivibrio sp. D14AmB TaxID=3374370 RepID=UPI00376EB80A